MTPPAPHPSLEEVFRKYRDFVYRLCLRYCRNPRDAEDLTQDVFIKLHRRLPDFRGNSAMTTWIYRIAANSCIDALRARKDHARIDDLEMDKVVAFNISGHCDAALARIDLERILAQTDAKTREILFLSLAEGCGHEEVGEVVGLTKWAVGKVVLRFQKKIQANKKAWFAELFHLKPVVPVPATVQVRAETPGVPEKIERQAA
jgi:RNA polymerase sigma-70 factor, ECF subfamily